MRTIYVSQSSASAVEVLANSEVLFDCLFPEVRDGKPLTPPELLSRMPSIWEKSKTIGTTSEAVVLWVCKQVRDGQIDPQDFIMYQVTDWGLLQHQLDADGDFDTHWADGFFDWRAPLLFDLD